MKLIKISDLVLDEKYYPRMRTDWLTAHQYAEAMKAGAKFPPIEVAHFKGKMIVVDGWHRIEAYKRNKEKYIQANIWKPKDAKEIYLEAVKFNSHHGRQFSVQERVNICLRLQDFKIERATIENLVGIPADSWECVVGGKITNTFTGKEIALKSPLQNFAGEAITDEQIEAQKSIATMSQLQLLDNMIVMLENKLFDLKNETVKEKINKIKELI